MKLIDKHEYTKTVFEFDLDEADHIDEFENPFYVHHQESIDGLWIVNEWLVYDDANEQLPSDHRIHQLLVHMAKQELKK
jgi:hypothetical protein